MREKVRVKEREREREKERAKANVTSVPLAPLARTNAGLARSARRSLTTPTPARSTRPQRRALPCAIPPTRPVLLQRAPKASAWVRRTPLTRAPRSLRAWSRPTIESRAETPSTPRAIQRSRRCVSLTPAIAFAASARPSARRTTPALVRFQISTKASPMTAAAASHPMPAPTAVFASTRAPTTPTASAHPRPTSVTRAVTSGMPACRAPTVKSARWHPVNKQAPATTPTVATRVPRLETPALVRP